MSAKSLGSRAILGQLYQRLELGAVAWADNLTMTVESDQGSEEHRWLGMAPALREWKGGRHVHGLRDSGIVIENKKFEATIEVSVDEIRRDKTAQVMARVNGLATRAQQHTAKLLSTLVEGGASAVCYDGQYYFDTDHSEGDSGSQSNDISIDISALPVAVHGSTTAPSSHELQQVFLQQIQAMLGFKDDQGEPINESAMQFMAMVPISYWANAQTAVSAAQLAAGETNVILNMDGFSIQVVANPRLTWTDKCAMFRIDGNDGGKPFIRQVEKPMQIKAQAEDSPEEFNNDRHVYGVDYNGNVGFGLWQHAALATLT